MFVLRSITLALAGCAVSPFLHAEKLVAVRATADAAYAQRHANADPAQPETYVFAKGKFFGGVVHDNTLDRTPFMRIAETLAYDLRRQNYQPARDFKTADLLIVVHWGVTMANDNHASMATLDPNSLIDAMSAITEARALEDEVSVAGVTAIMLGTSVAAEASYSRTASDLASTFERNDMYGASNAELLGFVSAMNKESTANLIAESEMSRTLREMTNEERYFIIMVAYDAQALRAGRKKRLWTSRMSIRSAGVNFTMALDRMSSAGGKFHGTRQQDLALEYQKDRPGFVKIGDLKVINDSPPAPTSAPTKP